MPRDKNDKRKIEGWNKDNFKLCSYSTGVWHNAKTDHHGHTTLPTVMICRDRMVRKDGYAETFTGYTLNADDAIKFSNYSEAQTWVMQPIWEFLADERTWFQWIDPTPVSKNSRNRS